MIELPKLLKPQADAAPRWFHVVVAIAMILSAIAALITSWRTSSTMSALVNENSRMVHAATTPLLEMDTGNVTSSGEPQLSFTLSNVGTGTARIAWLELRLDGVAMSDMHTLARRLHPAGGSSELNMSTSGVAPRMLPAGKEIAMLRWSQPPESDATQLELWRALNKARMNRVEAQACYCSVLDACWTSNLQGDTPKPVERCDAAGHNSLKG